MKPNPFASLNHLTVPVAITASSLADQNTTTHKTATSTIALADDWTAWFLLPSI
jgi:hypothetical protein